MRVRHLVVFPEENRLRILVVDDEPDLLEVIRLVLGRSGHSSRIVKSGEEALDVLAAEHFDLVLCDLVMQDAKGQPTMSGAQVYDALKTKGDPVTDRMVFISANTRSSENQRFLDRCGRPYLDKPFTIGGLATVIDQMAEKVQGGGRQSVKWALLNFVRRRTGHTTTWTDALFDLATFSNLSCIRTGS